MPPAKIRTAAPNYSITKFPNHPIRYGPTTKNNGLCGGGNVLVLVVDLY
jgi:hypothetical protein